MRRIRAITILCAVAVLTVPGPLLVSAQRLAGARARCRAAELSLQRVANDAARVVELRSSRQTIAEQKRPEQDVIARVNAALSEAGVPERHFGGLRPESDQGLPGSACRRQTLRITLRQLSLPELGAFLERWAASQELWTPTRIELSRAQTQNDPGRYDAAILIAATYIASP